MLLLFVVVLFGIALLVTIVEVVLLGITVFVEFTTDVFEKLLSFGLTTVVETALGIISPLLFFIAPVF